MSNVLAPINKLSRTGTRHGQARDDQHQSSNTQAIHGYTIQIGYGPGDLDWFPSNASSQDLAILHAHALAASAGECGHHPQSIAIIDRADGTIVHSEKRSAI